MFKPGENSSHCEAPEGLLIAGGTSGTGKIIWDTGNKFDLNNGRMTVGAVTEMSIPTSLGNFLPSAEGSFKFGNPSGSGLALSLAARSGAAQPFRIYGLIPAADSGSTNPAINFIAAVDSWSAITTERTRLFGWFNQNTNVGYIDTDTTWRLGGAGSEHAVFGPSAVDLKRQTTLSSTSNYPLTIGTGVSGTTKILTFDVGGTGDAVIEWKNTTLAGTPKLVERFYNGSTHTVFRETLSSGETTFLADLYVQNSAANNYLSLKNTSTTGVANQIVYNDASKYVVSRTYGSSTVGSALGRPRATTSFIASNQDIGLGTVTDNTVYIGANDATVASFGSTVISLNKELVSNLTSTNGYNHFQAGNSNAGVWATKYSSGGQVLTSNAKSVSNTADSWAAVTLFTNASSVAQFMGIYSINQNAWELRARTLATDTPANFNTYFDTPIITASFAGAVTIGPATGTQQQTLQAGNSGGVPVIISETSGSGAALIQMKNGASVRGYIGSTSTNALYVAGSAASQRFAIENAVGALTAGISSSASSALLHKFYVPTASDAVSYSTTTNYVEIGAFGTGGRVLIHGNKGGANTGLELLATCSDDGGSAGDMRFTAYENDGSDFATNTDAKIAFAWTRYGTTLAALSRSGLFTHNYYTKLGSLVGGSGTTPAIATKEITGTLSASNSASPSHGITSGDTKIISVFARGFSSSSSTWYDLTGGNGTTNWNSTTLNIQSSITGTVSQAYAAFIIYKA